MKSYCIIIKELFLFIFLTSNVVAASSSYFNDGIKLYKQKKLEKSQINKIIVTDTIEISKEKIIDKVKIVSVSKVFSEAVSRIHKGESVSALFEFQKGD